MIYKAYLKQDGEGCDYTIGCGQIVIDVEASNIEDAKLQLYKEIEENYTGESELELCELYEIKQVVVCNLKEWYKRIEDADYAIKQQEIEAIEREEFERLKAKFGN
jgi:2,3-bisphosphoglycerate-independent phosphoglycerate mutase